MADPKIRPAAKADLPAVQKLFEAFYREEGLAHAVGRVATTLPQIVARADTACFVATSGKRIVGAAAMSTSYGLEVGLYAELEDLYVLPAWRKKGVGEALVDEVLAEAYARGCADVEVVLTGKAQKDRALNAWYDTLGFKKTGRAILECPLSDEDDNG